MDDEVETLFVEIGDFTKFQLQYLDGHAPTIDNEIAFSTLSMQSLDKEVGDQVRVIRGDDVVLYDIVGVYQDITNGGKTAKAVSTDFKQDLLWNVVNVNVTQNSDVNTIRNEYSAQFEDAKVTSIQEYLTQTLGDTIEQLRIVAIASIIISVVIIILITALFLNMLLVKETHQIAIMKSIGVNNFQIGLMYITRIIVVLLMGVFIGIVITSVIGDDIISIISRAFGASRLVLKQDPFFIWILVPTMTIIVGIVTSSIVVYQNKLSSISNYLNT